MQLHRFTGIRAYTNFYGGQEYNIEKYESVNTVVGLKDKKDARDENSI
ncbi:MAG: hypothetical protein LBS81_03715 [Endomicrobium sp.]|jgi:hypothetical protein|nr:hypothetical protein [Endomicrobium sp.]